MNLQDVSKREVLDFKQFLGKVHDFNYKPLSPKNQIAEPGKTGLYKIKRQPAFDYAGYADAAFDNTSKIGYAGISLRNPETGEKSSSLVGGIPGGPPGGSSLQIGVNENEEFSITRFTDFNMEA